MSDASAKHVRALVDERHSEVRRNFDALLDAIASNERVKVQRANVELNDSLLKLSQVVARKDWPNWLSQLLAHSNNYKTNHNNGSATWKAHLLSLIEHKNNLENHAWFSDETRPEFDPESIIEEARAAHKIDNLFSRIVDILRSLASCEELDSVKACEDLKKIIEILRRAQRGDFASQVLSWQFARRFIPNLIGAYLKRSDLTGPIMEAFEQTASELDMAFEAAKDDIGQKLIETASVGFRSKALENIAPTELRVIPDLRNVDVKKKRTRS